MVWAKKRFEVLKRDWFRCMYCWKNGKDVTLEIDHILPKSKGWLDTLDNLTTSCRECNMGKWKTRLDEKITYKMKISDAIYELIMYLYREWNKLNLWTICPKTKVLLSLGIKESMGWDMFCQFLEDYPKEKGISIGTLDERKKKFELWTDYCDIILASMIIYEKKKINEILEEISNDALWEISKNEERFNYRLNYRLTLWAEEYLVKNKKVLYKLSFYPDIFNYD